MALLNSLIETSTSAPKGYRNSSLFLSTIKPQGENEQATDHHFTIPSIVSEELFPTDTNTSVS